MELLKFLLFAYFFFRQKHSFALTDGKTDGRIIGGNVAKIGQFPFMAALYSATDEYTFICGGSLISSEWILTSARCLYEVKYVTVCLGSITLESYDPNRITLVSTDLFPHSEFDVSTFLNDIGLIKLPVSVEFSDYVQPIKLAAIALPTILKPTALGWGQTSDDDPSLAPELMRVDVGVLSNDKCKEIYGSQLTILTDEMVCTQGTTNEGGCYGDMGGPLVVRPLGSSVLEHVGVFIFFSGRGCENSDPAGYTRTYPYVAWIKNITGIL